MIAAANKAVAGGSVAAAVGGAAVKVSWIAQHGGEIATVCSMIGASVAVVGLIVSITFQFRRDWRERNEFVERRRADRRRK